MVLVRPTTLKVFLLALSILILTRLVEEWIVNSERQKYPSVYGCPCDSVGREMEAGRVSGKRALAGMSSPLTTATWYFEDEVEMKKAILQRERNVKVDEATRGPCVADSQANSCSGGSTRNREESVGQIEAPAMAAATMEESPMTEEDIAMRAESPLTPRPQAEVTTTPITFPTDVQATPIYVEDRKVAEVTHVIFVLIIVFIGFILWVAIYCLGAISAVKKACCNRRNRRNERYEDSDVYFQVYQP